MIGHWNSEEDDALQYLPLRAQVIYLRGIRRFADSHGIAGAKNRISWKSLSEVAEFRPAKSSNLPKDIPSRKAIRSAIEQLERAGLIEVLPESARFSGLVFRCLLAAQDQSVKMRKGLRGAMEEGPCENGETMRFSEEGGAMEKTPKTAKEGPASPSPYELPNGSSNSCASAGRFGEFWKAYPVKKGKAKAERLWKSKKLDRIADQLLEDVRNRQSSDRKWREGYIPHGDTYVSKEVWQDDIEHIEGNRHETHSRNHKLSAAERAIEDEREFERRSQAEYCRVYDIAGQRIK